MELGSAPKYYAFTIAIMNERGFDEFFSGSDPDKAAFLSALLNVATLQELPDTEGGVQAWAEKNPEAAGQLETTLDHIISEFGGQGIR